LRQGWFSLGDVEELAREMAYNPGDSSHPPGPVRVARVRQCMTRATPDLDRGSSSKGRAHVSSDRGSDTHPQFISQLLSARPSGFRDLKGARDSDGDWQSATCPEAASCSISDNPLTFTVVLRARRGESKDAEDIFNDFTDAIRAAVPNGRAFQPHQGGQMTLEEWGWLVPRRDGVRFVLERTRTMASMQLNGLQ
jgi:hypothetical protein